MAGLSRAVTEAIMETRWDYFGGSIDSISRAGPPRTRRKTAGPPAQHPRQGHVLSQGGAGSLWIQAIDCGLITHEDILINRQIPELPHPSCPPPSLICSHFHA